MIAIKDIQLLWVYRSRLTPGSGIRSHSHEYYHLLCICSGQMEFTAGGAQHLLRGGDVIIVPRDTEHSFRNCFASEVIYYEIKFSVLSAALTQYLCASPLCLHGDAFAYSLTEHVAQEYLRCRARRDESAAGALSTLLYHVTSDSRLVREGEPEIIDTADYTPLTKKVIDFLTANYHLPLTLDDVAADAGVSKNYLCNAFKRSTGVTILECLNVIRIRKAAELIVYSDLSLAQVAKMCGYVSASHFNRVFSHYTGIPPGQCRRAFSFHLSTQAEQLRRQPDSFMYSVLAGKSISPARINAFEETRSD